MNASNYNPKNMVKGLIDYGLLGRPCVFRLSIQTAVKLIQQIAADLKCGYFEGLLF